MQFFLGRIDAEGGLFFFLLGWRWLLFNLFRKYWYCCQTRQIICFWSTNQAIKLGWDNEKKEITCLTIKKKDEHSYLVVVVFWGQKELLLLSLGWADQHECQAAIKAAWYVCFFSSRIMFSEWINCSLLDEKHGASIRCCQCQPDHDPDYPSWNNNIFKDFVGSWVFFRAS